MSASRTVQTAPAPEALLTPAEARGLHQAMLAAGRRPGRLRPGQLGP